MGIQTSSINSGPVAGFKNKIINGNFDLWQRGTTSTVTTAGSNFLADRYIWNTSGNTITVSRQAFTLGQTDVPGNPTYFNRMQITAAVAAQPSIEQRIEDVRTLAGQQVTFSFWAKGASNFTLTYGIVQSFGTGGSPSSSVSVTSGTLSVTASWQRFTITTTMPSISGKTLGSNNDSYVQIAWQMPASATNTFDLAQVQFEQGPVATTFEQRVLETELRLCQRYYQVFSNFYIEGYASIGNTRAVTAPMTFPVQMRTTPTRSVITAGTFNNIRGSSTTYAGLGLNGLTATFASASIEAAAAGWTQYLNATEAMSAEL